jgi:hypothetical protein
MYGTYPWNHLVRPVNDVLHQNVVVPIGPGPPVDLEENDAEGVHVTLLGSSCQHLRIPVHAEPGVKICVVDPDPHWECGSESGSMEIDQN